MGFEYETFSRKLGPNEVVVGIDPGKSGAIAVISRDGYTAHAFKSSVQAAGVVADVALSPLVHIFSERVGASEGMGKSHAFEFGRNVGHWEGIISAFGLDERVTLVDPRTWQNYFPGGGPDLEGVGDDYELRKRVLKNFAIEIFPGIKVTLKTADALLVAAYGLYEITKSR